MGATGGRYTNNLFAIALDESDHPIVAHSYTEPRKIKEQQLPFTEKSQHNGLLLKMDDDGSIEWYQTWNLPKLESSSNSVLISREFNAMVVDAEGNIYAAGKDSVNVPLGAFVAKVSPNGEKLWEVKLEGWIEDIKLGTDGYIYTVGSYSESYPSTTAWGVSQPTLPPSRRSAAFVVKISAQGDAIMKYY